jgi:hypothetical protein
MGRYRSDLQMCLQSKVKAIQTSQCMRTLVFHMIGGDEHKVALCKNKLASYAVSTCSKAV